MIGEIFNQFLSYMEIILCMWGICQAEFKKKKIIFLYGMLAFFSTYILMWAKSKYGITIYTALAAPFINIVLNSLIFKGKLFHNIIKSMFIYSYLVALYFPMQSLYDIFQLNDYPVLFQFKNEIQSMILSLCIYLMGLQIKKHKLWVRWIQNIPVGYFFIGFIFGFSATGIFAFIYTYIDTSYYKTQIFMRIIETILMVFLCLFGIAIAFINLMKENYRRENILKDEYLKKSREHYQNLKKHIAEVQKIRHDMKNHLQLLEFYIDQRDWEKAHNYLKEIDSHQQWNYKPLVNIGNDLANAVLNSGLENIDPEIIFKVEGVIPPTLEIQEFDLCTIFSNLLSNSIEACEKLKEHEKIILLSIRTFQNQMILSFKNPIEEDINKENLGKISSKKDRLHHGYGIRNIMDAVEKYGGTVDFLLEDSWFEVIICLSFTAYS